MKHPTLREGRMSSTIVYQVYYVLLSMGSSGTCGIGGFLIVSCIISVMDLLDLRAGWFGRIQSGNGSMSSGSPQKLFIYPHIA